MGSAGAWPSTSPCTGRHRPLPTRSSRYLAWRFVADFCDALDLTGVDLVGNDTGGAICQAFAASHPEQVHTLVLTNCEAHDNLPPRALAPLVLLSRTGLTARIMPRLLLSEISRGRKRMYGTGYENADEVVEIDGARLFFPDERAAEFTAELRRHWDSHP
jgi:pimeloyl-ACP methyl ester carboxylesterase